MGANTQHDKVLLPEPRVDLLRGGKESISFVPRRVWQLSKQRPRRPIHYAGNGHNAVAPSAQQVLRCGIVGIQFCGLEPVILDDVQVGNFLFRSLDVPNLVENDAKPRMALEIVIIALDGPLYRTQQPETMVTKSMLA